MNGLFVDPLAATAPAPAPVRKKTSGPEQATGQRSDRSRPAAEATPGKNRQERQAPDEKTLRAASLLKVSRDLERLLRQRGR